MKDKQFMTIREVARTGILCENTIRTLVKSNSIPYIKVGNRVLINYETLLESLNKNSVSSTKHSDSAINTSLNEDNKQLSLKLSIANSEILRLSKIIEKLELDNKLLIDEIDDLEADKESANRNYKTIDIETYNKLVETSEKYNKMKDLLKLLEV